MSVPSPVPARTAAPTSGPSCRCAGGAAGSSTPSGSAGPGPVSWAGRVGAVLLGLGCVVACAAPGLLAAGAAGLTAAVGGATAGLTGAVAAGVAVVAVALVLARRRRAPRATCCPDRAGC
jgi:hypothetical protein